MQSTVTLPMAERRRANSTLIPHASEHGRMMTLRLDGYDSFIVHRTSYYTTQCTCPTYLEERQCDHINTLLRLHLDHVPEVKAPEPDLSEEVEKFHSINMLTIDRELRRGAGQCTWDPVIRLSGPNTGKIASWLNKAGFTNPAGGSHMANPLTVTKLIDLSYLISEGAPNLAQNGWTIDVSRSPIRLHNYHDGISLDFKTVNQKLSFQVGGIAKEERAFALSKLIDLALIYQNDSTERFLAEVERTQTRGNRIYIAHEDVNEFRVIVIDKAHGLKLLEACHRLAVSATVEGDRAWLPPTKMADIAALEHDHKGFRKAENLKKLEGLYETITQTAIQPKLFTMPLDPPQLQGLAWLQALFDAGYGGILADEMGVGKTAQMLAHIALLIERDKLEHQALMIVPKTALSNWEKEAVKFVPDIPMLVWDGNNRRRLEAAMGDAQIVLTSPALVKLDKDVFKRHWTFIGIDEAQDVRNPENQNTLAIAKMDADQKVPATGTPVENHLGDLWTLMHLANPGLLGPHATFMAKVNDPVVEQAENAQQLLDDLNKSIAPFLLARTRADAGHVIPPPDAQQVPLEFSAQEREIYEIIASTMQKQIGETDGQPLIRRRGAVFKAIAMMRQATCDVRLIKDDFARDLNPGVSTKTRWCADYVAGELELGRKVLVFANWIGYLDIIAGEVEKTCGRSGWMANINGQMSRRQRGQAEEAFKAGEVDVLFITTKTGGKALNLPEADSVLIPDSWWNPQPENQAIARTQRRGQTKLVHVRRPIITNSIDEKLMAIQERKAGIAKSIIDPAFMGAKGNGLSFADMMNLIAA